MTDTPSTSPEAAAAAMDELALDVEGLGFEKPAGPLSFFHEWQVFRETARNKAARLAAAEAEVARLRAEVARLTAVLALHKAAAGKGWPAQLARAALALKDATDPTNVESGPPAQKETPNG